MEDCEGKQINVGNYVVLRQGKQLEFGYVIAALENRIEVEKHSGKKSIIRNTSKKIAVVTEEQMLDMMQMFDSPKKSITNNPYI